MRYAILWDCGRGNRKNSEYLLQGSFLTEEDAQRGVEHYRTRPYTNFGTYRIIEEPDEEEPLFNLSLLYI